MVTHIVITGSTATNMTANDFFDYDSILVEIILRANPNSSPGTFGFITTVTMDTDETAAMTWDKSTDIVTTSDLSGISTVR